MDSNDHAIVNLFVHLNLFESNFIWEIVEEASIS